MSLRKKVKGKYKQAKDDMKSFFKTQDDPKPSTASGTLPHGSAPGVPAQTGSSNPGVSGSLPLVQVPASEPAAPPSNDNSNAGNQSEPSPRPTTPIRETHPSAARPGDMVSQASGTVGTTSTNNTLSGPENINQLQSSGGQATSQEGGSGGRISQGQQLVQVVQGAQGGSSTSWKALKEFARVLEPATSIFGPVKDMAGVFLECVDKYEMTGEAQTEYKSLTVRLEGLFEDLQLHFGDGHLPIMTSTMERLCRSIEEELNYVREQHNRNIGERYLSAPDEMNKILASYRRIEGHLQRLSLNANLSMWKIVHEQSVDSGKDRMSSRVDRLPSSLPAWYNSAEGIELKRRACTPGTRVDVIANILAWTTSSGDEAVYWLNGMAGTGKTTIIYSVCADLDDQHQLGASFFCSRLREECRNANLIIPSIAYQLARFSRPFQSALSAVLEKDPDIHGRLPHMQFDALIAKPMLEVQHTIPEGVVVVIDALDECEQKESTGCMLDVLLSKSAGLPIKFIVSSRPEAEIRDRMAEDGTTRTHQLALHALDKGAVQTDIETYLRAELTPMQPTDVQITALVEKAGILFIYAATAVRYIGYSNFHRNPSARLRTILNGSQGKRTGENKEIDQLYITILEAAFEDPGLEEADREEMQQVLNTVVCAREPLTITELSRLLQIDDAERVRDALRPLWSVLHVVETTELVTTLHASFPDFIFDSARSNIYCCHSEAHNRILAERCFEHIIKSNPEFNLCGLESSCLPDKNVPNLEGRVTKVIPPELLYACRYWAHHVKEGELSSKVVELLREFLSKWLLLWMEVLNLNNRMGDGTESMKLAVEICNRYGEDQELVELAHDAHRFVDTFASNPVSQSTPHIYVSMLLFWPRSTPVAQHYAGIFHGPVEAEGTALNQRQRAHLATWAIGKHINSIAVSPNGLCIALAIGDNVVALDSSTGRVLLGPLQGHTNEIYSVAFSLDGTRVLSGSCSDDSAMVIGWDIRNGNSVLGPLQLDGHTDRIMCLAFSPDCTRVATGSFDRTVCLWSTENGNLMLSLQTQSWVFATVFSHDSSRIAASHKTMQVWNSATGATILGPLSSNESIFVCAFPPDRPHIAYAARLAIYVRNTQSGDIMSELVHGHTDNITCLTYSPDGRYLVSGSNDRTLQVWDVWNSKLVLGPLEGHTGNLTSVVFSPDGSRIITGCTGGLVCVWDVRPNGFASGSTNGFTKALTTANFSSNGAYFVAGSTDGTISIWDSHSGEMTTGPIQAYQSEVTAVDILNDRAVLGSDDGKICICDAVGGEIILGPLEANPGKTIRPIKYSPDGRLIASGSRSGVSFWNAHDGNRVLNTLNANRTASSIKFSPDNTRIVVGSMEHDCPTSVWDVSSGENVFGDLEGHTAPVRTVSYSPNGALIASGSNDYTIILWDAYTGKPVLDPLTGHSGYVMSVDFSPDSNRLASGSLDKTIRIWDVQKGAAILTFESGHDQGIRSIEYSPDGTRILSYSWDRSARIHDAQIVPKGAATRPGAESGDWKMNKDGWIVDDQSRLLVWVPGDLRKAMAWPRTQLIVAEHGYVRVKFEESRMGESWANCYKARV